MSSRSDALTVSCPECGSVPEEPCCSKRGDRRASCHEGRHQEFRALREALVEWHKEAGEAAAA